MESRLTIEMVVDMEATLTLEVDFLLGVVEELRRGEKDTPIILESVQVSEEDRLRKAGFKKSWI